MDVRKLSAWCLAAYLLLSTIIIVPIACVSTFIMIMPLLLVNRPLFLKLENRLCQLVNDHWATCSYFCGLQVIEYGDDISAITDKRVLFLANHQGFFDNHVIMNSLQDKGKVPGSYLWVIYNIWKCTPLGVMWTIHGNFFVNGGPKNRERELGEFRKLLSDYFWSWNYGWVVMYPEGSRLFKIRESSARFAEKNGLAPLRHCTYPRLGAAHALMQVCAPSKEDATGSRSGGGPPMDYIVDATLGYTKGRVIDLGSALMGEWPLGTGKTCIHYKIHKVKPEYADEEKLKDFLYELYKEKDDLLDKFYRTDDFPGEKRTVQLSTTTIIASQVFWGALYYAHYSLWIAPLCSTVLSAITSFLF
ncbi:hypothetical protein PMAYCL1PPCAC_03358 [Pristionchus mayeri]|uniref:Phospholipid/glycerol acyltransferase domain-containing protein n=1 Tax=Pristionchus mayeri TaxID=1317129 RepID=A0AAN4Z746_9BILA|nr:hypothetical protein PMAYCL1PPCAC_03358 [Pristionchus mayeri]